MHQHIYKIWHNWTYHHLHNNIRITHHRELSQCRINLPKGLKIERHHGLPVKADRAGQPIFEIALPTTRLLVAASTHSRKRNLLYTICNDSHNNKCTYLYHMTYLPFTNLINFWIFLVYYFITSIFIVNFR